MTDEEAKNNVERLEARVAELEDRLGQRETELQLALLNAEGGGRGSGSPASSPRAMQGKDDSQIAAANPAAHIRALEARVAELEASLQEVTERWKYQVADGQRLMKDIAALEAELKARVAEDRLGQREALEKSKLVACVHVPDCECHEPGDTCYEVVADNPPERED